MTNNSQIIIYQKEAELNENSVTEEYSTTASDGKNYRVKHYNLDAIISIGYRINSTRAHLLALSVEDTVNLVLG
jgi:hypothetical protein